jgi:predicted Zn-dependent protease
MHSDFQMELSVILVSYGGDYKDDKTSGIFRRVVW